jgi:hypothetical protein
VKYIICGAKAGPYGTDQRPTLDSFKSFGEGQYAIRRGDGSISKNVLVTINKNGNFRVQSFTPEGLDAISTVVLKRMVRAYGPIVKAWPRSASARDFKKVVDEVQARAALVGLVSNSKNWVAASTPEADVIFTEEGSDEAAEMEASEAALVGAS